MERITLTFTAMQRTIVLACLGFFCNKILGAQVVLPPADASCGIHSPGQTYSAQEIDAMFDRPRDVEHLLRNLRLAMEKDLFVQPGFYTDAHLMKFFGGTQVTWSTPSGQGEHNSWRLFKVTPDRSVFPEMIVELLHSCRLEPAYSTPSGTVPAHVKAGASVKIPVETVPGFTVAAVRHVFGTETQKTMESGNGLHGHFTPTVKGSLNYQESAKQKSAESDVERSSVDFVIKLDSPKAVAAGAHPWQIDPDNRVQYIHMLSLER